MKMFKHFIKERKYLFFLSTVLICSCSIKNPYLIQSKSKLGLSCITISPLLDKFNSISDVFNEKVVLCGTDEFKRIGGYDAPSQTTSMRMAYTDSALCVYFKCANPNQIDGLIRDDKVVVYYSIAPTLGKYYESGIHLDGKVDFLFDGKSLQKQFANKIEKDSAYWYANMNIPWNLIGGKPTGNFAMNFFRENDTTGEKQTPTGSHFYNNWSPGMYCNAILGDKPMAIYGKSVFEKLPSGRYCWQKPITLQWPAQNELNNIWQLQNSLDIKTDSINLGSRIATLQSWFDLLTLDGMSFHEHSGNYIIPQNHYTPWVAYDVVNRALWKNDFAKTCHIIDTLIADFDIASRKWFADGSPENIRNDCWEQIQLVKLLGVNSDTLTLQCQLKSSTFQLKINLTSDSGIRIFNQSGFFIPAIQKLPVKSEKDNNATFLSHEYTIHIVSGKNWEISLSSAENKKLLSLNKLSFKVMTKNNQIKAFRFGGNIIGQEDFYGAGERFNSVNFKGNVLNFWNTDAWDGDFNGIFNQSYKCIPLIHSTLGYSIFINSTYHIRADFGLRKKDSYEYVINGPVFDLIVWDKPLAQAVQSFVSLTGKPILPPKWVFEPWMGGGADRWEKGPDATQTGQIIDEIKKFDSLEIKHSAVYAEGTASYDSVFYKFANQHNIRVLTWSSPWNISPNKAQKLLNIPYNNLPYLRDSKGGFIDYTTAIGMCFPTIDFLNPEAIYLERESFKNQFNLGLKGSMVDFAEVIPDSAIFYNGWRGDRMHNFYPYHYNKTYNQVFREKLGTDFVLFARSAAPGSQHFTCQFAGDHQTNFDGLRAALKGGINLATCGFPFWGCDIGGYLGSSLDEETYFRWVEWGAFQPIMRFHGTTPREPWYYSPENLSVSIYTKYNSIRYSFAGYFYSLAVQAHQSGTSIINAVFVDNKVCNDEYMIGNDLLVAPMVTPGQQRNIAFTNGTWISIWNNQQYNDPKTTCVNAPIDVIPVFLSEGAVIPVTLPNSLILGDKLGSNFLKAILITTPTKTVEKLLFTDSVNFNKVVLSPVSKGFILTVNQTPNCIIVYKANREIEKVLLNNAPILKLDTKVYKPGKTGYYVDENNRLIIILEKDKKCDLLISYAN